MAKLSLHPVIALVSPHSSLPRCGRTGIANARHGEADARGGRPSPVHRFPGSEPLRLRTRRLCDRSRPLRSSVVEYHADCIHGLTQTLREDRSGK